MIFNKKIAKNIFASALILFLLCFVQNNLFAQDVNIGSDILGTEVEANAPQANKPEWTPTATPTPFSQKGRLATIFSAGMQANQAGVWAGDVGDGGKGAPISASISRNGRSWKVVVTNTSEDQYSFSIKASQLDAKGRSIRNNFASFSLKAGAQASREFVGVNGAASAVVDLTKWNKKAKQAGKDELEEEIQKKEFELKELRKQVGEE